MLNSTTHWQPLVNGYSDHIPQDFRDAARHLSSFPSRESFAEMRQRRVRYVIVHRNRYSRQAATDVEQRLQNHEQHLRLLSEDERVLLFEVVSWPQ
jgi:hypothetical protein